VCLGTEDASAVVRVFHYTKPAQDCLPLNVIVQWSPVMYVAGKEQ
jgi:hypothetical protein